MMTPKKSFEILEIQPNATVEDIKKAYRDLANVWHPDRFSHSIRLKKKAEEKLKEINIAYQELTANQFDNSMQSMGTQIAEKRNYPRKSCLIAIEYASHDRIFSPFTDFIQNISCSGIFIQTEKPFIVGQKITSTFSLPRFGDLKNILGEIIRNSPQGIGVKFRISNRYQKFLSGFL